MTNEERQEIREDVDNCVFRTYNGWVKKGRRVLKGETAMLVSNTLDVPIYLFSKDQTTKVKSRGDYGLGYGDCSGYDDYGYDGDVDSLYGM